MFTVVELQWLIMRCRFGRGYWLLGVKLWEVLWAAAYTWFAMKALSLYKGLTPALISMGPSCAVFYAIYDILNTSHLSHINKNGSCSKMDEERELSVVRTLLYGAIAGACAETATYPLEVIRRQLQLHQAKRVGLVTVFVKLVQREGVGSLFAGLAPCTLQVCSISTLPSFLFFIDASTVSSLSCITTRNDTTQLIASQH